MSSWTSGSWPAERRRAALLLGGHLGALVLLVAQLGLLPGLRGGVDEPPVLALDPRDVGLGPRVGALELGRHVAHEELVGVPAPPPGGAPVVLSPGAAVTG